MVASSCFPVIRIYPFCIDWNTKLLMAGDTSSFFVLESYQHSMLSTDLPARNHLDSGRSNTTMPSSTPKLGQTSSPTPEVIAALTSSTLNFGCIPHLTRDRVSRDPDVAVSMSSTATIFIEWTDLYEPLTGSLCNTDPSTDIRMSPLILPEQAYRVAAGAVGSVLSPHISRRVSCTQSTRPYAWE